jgi:predicted acetyltransferase
MTGTVTLRLPLPAEAAEFAAARRAASADLPSFLHGYADGMTLPAYLARLADVRAGHDLRDDEVPETFLFAFAGARLVGRVAIRHHLTPALLQAGGHIGYAVLPAFRRRGYATEMLRLALGVARDGLGLTRVLLTCDDDNAASIRVIEKNGGVLEDVVAGAGGAAATRRYWIALRPGASGLD